jgi:3-oxoacyl-[acyl-carrier protein] reductase
MTTSGLLAGKVAIVTGSGRGIGRATAELLSEQGASVLVNDLDEAAVTEVANSLPGEAAVFACDLTKDGAPDGVVAHAMERWGRIDIIVNNAGYAVDSVVHKMTDESFQRMLDIHLIVPFRIIRAAAPHLREPAKLERAEGREVFRKIVNVSSVVGTMGAAGQANYAAGKAGLIGVTKSLAKEWGQFRVNVNAVAFGSIDTRMLAEKTADNVFEIGGEQVRIGVPAEARELAASAVPFGRLGTPREAAGGVLLLCTPWADFINGQVLTISGGMVGGMST